jgi:hypothetical protein
MRPGLAWSIVVAAGLIGCTAVNAASEASPENSTAPAVITYVAGSTREICRLTGFGEKSTDKRFGFVAGDRGYSFEDSTDRVWWLFGDSRPTKYFPAHGQPNAATRYPADKAGYGNDAIAYSAPTPPGACPALTFMTETSPSLVPTPTHR